MKTTFGGFYSKLQPAVFCFGCPGRDVMTWKKQNSIKVEGFGECWSTVRC